MGMLDAPYWSLLSVYTNSVAKAYRRRPFEGLEGAGEGGMSWPSRSTLATILLTGLLPSSPLSPNDDEEEAAAVLFDGVAIAAFCCCVTISSTLSHSRPPQAMGQALGGAFEVLYRSTTHDPNYQHNVVDDSLQKREASLSRPPVEVAHRNGVVEGSQKLLDG
jgi:hypothetical protein